MNITPPDATLSTAPSDAVESLIAYCRENSRVCPMPQRWSALGICCRIAPVSDLVGNRHCR